MKRSLFFPIICKSVQQEIDEFDPETIQIAGESLRSDDVVIGELNEFERKCFCWLGYAELTYGANNTPQHLMDKLMRNDRLFEQFMDEQEILILRVETAIKLFHCSVFGRVNELLEGFTVTDQNGLAVREGRFLVITADCKIEAGRIEKDLERRLNSSDVRPQGLLN